MKNTGKFAWLTPTLIVAAAAIVGGVWALRTKAPGSPLLLPTSADSARPVVSPGHAAIPNVDAGATDPRAGMTNDLSDLTSARRLLDSETEKTREAGAALLAQMGSDQAVRLLLAAIKRERSGAVRDNMLECLRTVVSAEAVPALAEQARDLGDLELHRLCRNLLSSMDTRGVIAALLVLAEKSGDAIPEPWLFALAKASPPTAVAELAQGLSSSHGSIVSACVAGLAHQGSPEAFVALFDYLGTKPQGETGGVPMEMIETANGTIDSRLVQVCSDASARAPGTVAQSAAVWCLASMRDSAAGLALERGRNNSVDDRTRRIFQTALDRWNASFR